MSPRAVSCLRHAGLGETPINSELRPSRLETFDSRGAKIPADDPGVRWCRVACGVPRLGT